LVFSASTLPRRLNCATTANCSARNIPKTYNFDIKTFFKINRLKPTIDLYSLKREYIIYYIKKCGGARRLRWGINFPVLALEARTIALCRLNGLALNLKIKGNEAVVRS
jgi:hypothetical protein